MNQAVHQLLQLILQGLTWVVRTIEALWVWSWAQISAAFRTPLESLPAWKIAVGLLAIVVLTVLLIAILRRCMGAFGRIAAAFWAMVMMVFGVLAFVVMAGLFSRGFQWVVASVPDKFWEKFL